MTETKNRTQTAGAQMREDGMPKGQAPARQQSQPETAVQKAAREAVQFRDRLLTEVEKERPMIEAFLQAVSVDWEFFAAALRVGLNQTMAQDRDFFDPHTGVTVRSFIESVVKCSMNGLLPDGKQAAIARFKRVATFMPMVEGFCHILYQTGLVRDINHNVVRDGDAIDYDLGDDGYVRHKPPLKRVPNAETIAAWCVINLTTGGKLVELCDDQDLKEIAAVSRASKGPRVDWKDEMHRKGPFRRAMKRAPKNKRLEQLLQHDDENYDLGTSLHAQEAERRGVPKNRLFATRRKREVAPLLSDQQDDTPPAEVDEAEEIVVEEAEAEAVIEQEDDGEEQPSRPAVVKAISDMMHAEDGTGLAEIMHSIMSDPEMKDLTPGEEEWLRETGKTCAAKFTGAYLPRAIMSTTTGEREYEDPGVWQYDFLTKLSGGENPAQKAFWKANLPFVLEAKENGIAAADKVLDRARAKGFATEVHDAGR